MRKSFYKFVIQPIIDYACVIWGATSQYNQRRDPKNLLLPTGSFHILEAIEKFWLDGSTVRPIVRFKVIPHNCIAHPFCAYFMESFRAPSCTHTLKTWQICLDIEVCQLKNGYSSPKSTGTTPFFQIIVIKL